MRPLRGKCDARILLRGIVGFWDSLDAVGAGPDIEIVPFRLRMDALIDEARTLLEASK